MFSKRLVSVVVAFVFIISSASAQFRNDVGYEDLYDGETVSVLKEHIRTLSAAHLEGRKAGSEGEREAAQYVKEKFKEYGLDILVPVTGEEFGLKTSAGDTLTSSATGKQNGSAWKLSLGK